MFAFVCLEEVFCTVELIISTVSRIILLHLHVASDDLCDAMIKGNTMDGYNALPIK